MTEGPDSGCKVVRLLFWRISHLTLDFHYKLFRPSENAEFWGSNLRCFVLHNCLSTTEVESSATTFEF